MKHNIELPTFWKTQYFPVLDGLRAISVLFVMLNHIHAPYPKGLLGWLGVDVFFVLSGFLITTLLLREKERTNRIYLKGFYIRRFFRIVPIYLAVVLVYVATIWVSHDALKLSQLKVALPWLLTFLQEFRPAASGNIFGHAWTLGIEEKFYLLWPLIVVGLYPFRRRSVLWISFIGAGIFLLPHTPSRSYGGLLIGGIVAITLAKSSTWLAGRKLPNISDGWLCLFVVVGYSLTYYNEKYVLLFSAAVASIVAFLVIREGILRTILSNRVAVFIGKRSYGMYLIHNLVTNAVEKVMFRFLVPNWIAILVVSYGLSLLGACLLQIIIEKPCIALGRRLSVPSVSRNEMQAPLPATA